MRRVLVVDDEPQITASFEEAFELEEGYEVRCAHDGTGALEIIQEANLHLVILDWRLRSEVEGRDVLIYLKKNFPKIPVYVVTASIQHVEEIEKLGADKCLLKPCPNLIDTIKQAIPAEE